MLAFQTIYDAATEPNIDGNTVFPRFTAPEKLSIIQRPATRNYILVQQNNQQITSSELT